MKLRHLTSDVRTFLNEVLEAPPVVEEAKENTNEEFNAEEASEEVEISEETDNEILQQLNAATALWKDNGKFETDATPKTSWASKLKDQFNKLKPKDAKQAPPEIPVSEVLDFNANGIEWTVIFAHLEQLKASERDEIEELYKQILED